MIDTLGKLIEHLYSTPAVDSAAIDNLIASKSATLDQKIYALQQANALSLEKEQLFQLVFGVLSRKLNEAMTLEKSGKVDEAVAIYEFLAEEDYPGTMPFDRLRIYYSKKKDYHSALRVCEKYLSGRGRDFNNGSARAEYLNWVEKIKHKIDKGKNGH
jgi:tetratricopeptide (TPR) repeat protein